MKRDFIIYVSLTMVGIIMRALSDLDSVFEWSLNGDYLWGVGLAIILFAWAIHINKKTTNGKRKLITRFFLFTAISNLCDEAIFDPYFVSWEEWATAAGFYLTLFISQKYELVRRDRI